jgi:type I restriction-modification system DNA methylase subunit
MTAKRMPMSINHVPFQEYFKEIRSRYLTGDFTEITLRTPLENFIRNLSKDFNLIQEPKRTEKIGAPDFKAYKKNVKIGYIETKDLGKNLDEELKSEQIKRYRSSLDNIILTDYSRFMLLRGNQIPFDFNLFNLSDLDNSRFVISDEKIQEFLRLVEIFFSYNLPTIKSAEELSLELSKRAKLLKELAKEQLEEDISRAKNDESTSSVYDFYEGTKELIKDISIDDCADAYAQTITYGLFLAKMNCPSILDRNTAASYIPRSIGVIKRIFVNISGDSLPSNLSWIIDEIIDVLNASEMKDVLTEIDARGKKDRDPFTFFYEDFLSAYDPEKKKHLGVYYTPRPVVSFIVNSINHILKNDFNKLHGFADDDVTVLDPAIGTGTFLWLIYTLTLVELKNKGLGGLISKKIENHILKDFYGIEILITPYIIAHLKLSLALKKWHYELKDNDRHQVYLANTLEPFESHGLIPFMREISEESITANELKLRKKILVITANPPYRGMSANKGPWIQSLLKKGYTKEDGTKDNGYYQIDGKPLGEKNPKWLQDDYVKFIRFAQWKIDTAGEGIIGFITNHNYLDNPTFRGMRQSLVNSFNRIYILNLHGNSLKGEKCPDGSKDENVFDIKPGVAIALFVKNKKLEDNRVFYADLYGKREEKYHWLDRHNISNVKWKELRLESPYHFFIPEFSSLRREYEKYWKITDIFSLYSVGIVTARDNLTIKWSPEEVSQTISKFATIDPELARTIFKLGKDVRDWKVEFAQRDLRDSGLDKRRIVPILYRPFDIRYTYYTGKSRGFHCMPRPEVMSHMLKENLGLLTCRQQNKVGFYHAFVCENVVESCAVSNKTREITYLFPFYLHSENGTRDNSGDKEPQRKLKSNLNPVLLQTLFEIYKKEISPKDIFYYIYAILYSHKYRTKYAEFLKSDFPRIPFTEDYGTFKGLSEIGKELVSLHLMKIKLSSPMKFDVQGSNVVEFVEYKDGKVYINKEQFFAGVPEKTWNFYIGGYQVLDKWLKSRKKRELSGSEIEQFIQITEIINQTLDLMKKIDEMEFLE